MKMFNVFKTKIKDEGPVIRKFGWKRDLPDPRDHKYKIVAPQELPPLIDLRDKFPPVYDQKDLGSCVSNGIAAAFQFEQMKQGKETFMPSRLFIYYNARSLEGTINEDSGTMVRTGIKTAVKDGVCPEWMWDYDVSKFTRTPTQKCYGIALDNQVLEYKRITPHTLYEVKHCLFEGYPVVFGFTVFESFMSEEVATTGIAKMPHPDESPQGGHCTTICGFDDSKGAVIVRNSWSEKWGMEGYFLLPYGYITEPNMSADFWTIRLVE